MSFLKYTPLPYILIYVLTGLILPLGIDNFLITERTRFWESPVLDITHIISVVIFLLLITLLSSVFDSRKVIRLTGLFRLPVWLFNGLVNSIVIVFILVVIFSLLDGVSFSKIRHSGSISDGGLLGILYAILLPCVRFILIFELISKIKGVTKSGISKNLKWVLLLVLLLSISSMRSGFDIILTVLCLSRSPLNILKLRNLIIGGVLVISVGFVYKFGDAVEAYYYIQDSDYLQRVLSVRTTSGIHSTSAIISDDNTNIDMLDTALDTSWYRLGKLFGTPIDRPVSTINRQNFENIAILPEVLPNAGVSPGFLASVWSLGVFSGTVMILLLLPILGILAAGNANLAMILLLYYGGASVVFENPVNIFVIPSEIHLIGLISLMYAGQFVKRNRSIRARSKT